ncbi:hypothetical protein GALMADRAFT_96046 [Galerina marginata CBS 339.88]|uniref:Zn(2)-C6 fungal-type domain-containing protein n=1 Tax=Galerina marginata (strain CBS 339.88) TaxID=685588 RepID=A0A067T2B3_GALM3|nr:hypothetical protein GALMADRAFT_96046 [Galerina marginata CBS 339.88]
MPQAARKDPQSQRAQDKESKRARGALSCAECRRLKLKCDKTVPCSSCKRRGCSAICPNGSLITGQGTRFVLADTEVLHQKIATMSDRIRQLEDALAILQSSLNGPTGEPHPLLERELLKIKSSIELHSASNAPGGEEGAERDDEDEDGGEQYIDAFGTLAIRDDGAATFYGRSAGSESLLIGEVSSPSSTYPETPQNEPSPPHRYASSSSSYADFNSNPTYQRIKDGTLENSVTTLAASFPLAPSLSHGSSSAASVMSSSSSFNPSSLTSLSRLSPKHPITLQMLTAQYLPPYTEALRLVQLYLEQAPWFFGAVTQRQIESELLPLWYEEAAAAAPSVSPPAGGLAPSTIGVGAATTSESTHRTGTSHDLALLFVIFCFGALTDTNLPPPPDNAPAEKFYQLTKAALTLDPGAGSGVTADPKVSRNGILERPPSVATVQTLSLMAIYEGICSGENSIETTWALMGLACKLSQSIGLHRDCARWKLTPAEVQKRRALFWELFITDCWQSLATGRLATFSLPFVDCELPADPDQTIADDGSVQPSFPYWKARFGAECVSAVVQGTLTSRAPKYSIILDLDRKVRDMDLPLYAQGPPPQNLGLAQTMSHFMPQNYRELTLLYIHRCFFAHAISSNPLDPIKSQYAPSFLAGYRSACTIIASVKLQFSMFPAQIARFWVLWTHAFSASVMLASVATHSSRSKIAPAALLELRTACDLFENAAAYGGRAGKFLTILRRLQSKAQIAYRDANSGIPTAIPNDIFKPSQPNEAKDELSIFSGKTHTVSTKVTPSGGSAPAPIAPAPSMQSRGSSKSARSVSDSPKALMDHPSFAGVHPSLVSELNTFHGHIKAQIQNAYRSGGDLFSGVPMVVDPVVRGPPVRPKLITQSPQLPPYQQQHVQQYHHQPHLPQQQNDHQQAVYQAKMKQEQFERQEAERLQMERLDQERKETERREMERQEIERQELARQQQQEIQRQQQEIQRQQQQELQRQQQAQAQAHQEALQQQMEIQRQQEKLQQRQRQEQFRQQLEIQQQQMGRYHAQAYDDGTQRHGYTTVPAVPLDGPATSHPSQQIPAPSQYHHQQHHRQPSIERTCQFPPPVPHPNPPTQHHRQHVSQLHPHPIQPQHAGVPEHTPQPQQHSMYAIPPEYSHHPSPESTHSGTASVNYTPPSTSYGQPMGASPPAPSSNVAYIPDSYKYWPAASTSFAMPDQQTTSGYAAAPGPVHHQHQQYTPESALRGIAADDRSLQETWQTYMSNVGSPRQFFED